MSEKPNCICGHSYAAHTWGTSFCACYKSLEAQGELCGCKTYRPGLCSCGHAWEAHGFKDNSRNLVCPFCGKECKHWGFISETRAKPADVMPKIMETQAAKEIDDLFNSAGLCVCGHYEASHSTGGKCMLGTCACEKFASQAPKDDWKTEVAKEEEKKPPCKCGHSFNSHWEENTDEAGNSCKMHLTCAECYDRVEEDGKEAWVSTCQDYSPAVESEEVTEDPAKVNAEALRQIALTCKTCGHSFDKHGNYGCLKQDANSKFCDCKRFEHTNTAAMTVEEINKKIEEWKAKTPKVTSVTSPKAGYYQNGVYHSNDANTSGTYPDQGWWAKCSHAPVHVIKGQSGWGVWAGTKSSCIPHVLEYDIVLNLAGLGSVIPEHRIPFQWAKKYERIKTKEINLDWPDGSIPIISIQFWKDLKDHLEKAKSKMLIFCLGGHGRTGTAIACIMVACGWEADTAMQWIWDNYCKEAIETKGQEEYVRRVDRVLNGRKRKPVQKTNDSKIREEQQKTIDEAKNGQTD